MTEDVRPGIAVLASPGLDAGAARDVVGGVGGRVCGPDRARVALVLLDPAVPIGASMLGSAAAVPDAVPRVFVTVGTDAVAGWDVVADRTRAVLGRHSARSSDTFLSVARPFGDSAGWSAVTDTVREVIETVIETTAEVARAAAGDRSPSEARTEREALAELEAMRTRRARLGARPVGADRSEQATALRVGLASVRVQVVHEVGARRRELSARVAHALSRPGRAGLARFPAALAADLDAAGRALSAATADAVGDLERRVLGAEVAGSPPITMGSATDQPVPPRARASAEDVLGIVVGGSAGAGVGRVLAWALSLGGPWSVGVSAVCAIVMGAAVFRVRRTAATRSRLRRWGGEVVADAAASWEREVASLLVDVDARLTRAAQARARGNAVSRSEADACDRSIAAAALEVRVEARRRDVRGCGEPGGR